MTWSDHFLLAFESTLNDSFKECQAFSFFWVSYCLPAWNWLMSCCDSRDSVPVLCRVLALWTLHVQQVEVPHRAGGDLLGWDACGGLVVWQSSEALWTGAPWGQVRTTRRHHPADLRYRTELSVVTSVSCFSQSPNTKLSSVECNDPPIPQYDHLRCHLVSRWHGLHMFRKLKKTKFIHFFPSPPLRWGKCRLS